MYIGINDKPYKGSFMTTQHRMAFDRGYEFEVITWQEGCVFLEKTNPELVSAIKKSKPHKNHTFLKVRYKYGDPIILKSGAYLPTPDGNGISFNDKSLPKEFKDQFGFDPLVSNPSGVILNKNCERYNVYLEKNEDNNNHIERIMPQAVLEPGDIFGLSRPLNNIDPSADNLAVSPFFDLELSAGIRSLAMLAKINDARQYARLKLKSKIPTSFQYHWHVFREIALKYDSDWRAEVLFFSNSWFESLKKDEFAPLLAHLLQVRTRSNKIWHNSQIWNGKINNIEILHHLKTYPAYASDIARFIFVIGANSAPGFRPAIDESGAPIKLIQRVYRERYKLKYAPIIMEVAKFSKENRCLYFLLNHPTLPQINPEANYRSIIALLHDVQEIIQRLQQGILKNKEYSITLPALYKTALEMSVSSFHNDPTGYKNINQLSKLVEEDERFMKGLKGAFPEHSPFLNGCIKIIMK